MDPQGNSKTPKAQVPLRKSLLTIWLANLGLLILLVGLVAYVFTRRQESSVRDQIQNQAFRRVEAIRDRLVEEALSRNLETIQQITRSADWLDRSLAHEVSSDEVFAYMAIVSPNGEALLRKQATPAAKAPGAQELSTRPADEYARTQPAAVQWSESGVTHRVVPIVVRGVRVGSIQFGLSQAALGHRVSESRRPLLQMEAVLGLACVAVLVTSGVSVVRLIRRIRALHEGAARQERLSAIGRISRRIVHEIRNPLNTIRVQVAVIRRKIAKSDPESLQVANQQLESLEEEVTRIERFANSFLEAGQLPKGEPDVVAPAEIVEELVEFVKPEFQAMQAQVVVEKRDGSERLRIRIDRARLKRAILNIIKNAREAMSAGGQLTISLRRCSRRELQIDIQDTGDGIPSDELPHVFDVHYSKKPDGSGLGLAIVRQIVEEAGGAVQVRSEQGKGATFTIRLPLYRD